MTFPPRHGIIKKVCFSRIESVNSPDQAWRSRVAGRARTIGNRVTVKSRSRVRIPPSPPMEKSRSFKGCGIFSVLSRGYFPLTESFVLCPLLSQRVCMCAVHGVRLLPWGTRGLTIAGGIPFQVLSGHGKCPSALPDSPARHCPPAWMHDPFPTTAIMAAGLPPGRRNTPVLFTSILLAHLQETRYNSLDREGLGHEVRLLG